MMSEKELTVDQKLRAMEIALDWQAQRKPEHFLVAYLEVCKLVMLDIPGAEKILEDKRLKRTQIMNDLRDERLIRFSCLDDVTKGLASSD